MKIFGILGGLVILFIVGAFTYIAMADVPVVQTTVTREIQPDIVVAAPSPAPAPASVAPAAGTTAPPATSVPATPE